MSKKLTQSEKAQRVFSDLLAKYDKRKSELYEKDHWNWDEHDKKLNEIANKIADLRSHTSLEVLCFYPNVERCTYVRARIYDGNEESPDGISHDMFMADIEGTSVETYDAGVLWGYWSAKEAMESELVNRDNIASCTCYTLNWVVDWQFTDAIENEEVTYQDCLDLVKYRSPWTWEELPD